VRVLECRVSTALVPMQELARRIVRSLRQRNRERRTGRNLMMAIAELQGSDGVRVGRAATCRYSDHRGWEAVQIAYLRKKMTWPTNESGGCRSGQKDGLP
jgi:hypothetical protein